MISYRIPQPKIVYEVLNTEVIAIDFDTGNYYALVHVAKQIWQLIEQGATPSQIALKLANHYHREVDLVSADVNHFIEQLLRAGLLEKRVEAMGEIPECRMAAHGLDYAAPQMQQYTDVQSLLLLDPIHEVAEVGWPEKR